MKFLSLSTYSDHLWRKETDKVSQMTTWIVDISYWLANNEVVLPKDLPAVLTGDEMARANIFKKFNDQRTAILSSYFVNISLQNLRVFHQWT